jgi:hypothetical protein
MGKVAVTIDLTSEERGELEGLAGRRRTAQGFSAACSDCLALCGAGRKANRPRRAPFDPCAPRLHKIANDQPKPF